MRFGQHGVLIVVTLTLMGCSYFSSSTVLHARSKQYLSATSVPPLRIPPGLSSSQFHNYYPVSYIQYTEASKEVSIVPPGLMDNH